MYGATDCDDTERTRGWLRELGVAFREVNIDHDPESAAFVRVFNGGFQSTPTLVLGSGKIRLIVSEPGYDDLLTALRQAGLGDRAPRALR
jgi:mycoredoxin